MGKTRVLFKGTFHARMGTIKDRYGTSLQKQKILRRGGKNTQKNYTEKVFGEGNSIPLQYSSLENPQQRSWQASVYRVAESNTT